MKAEGAERSHGAEVMVPRARAEFGILVEFLLDALLEFAMIVLGHVAFNLHLSPTHNLVIHAGIVTELPAGLDFIFGMPSLRSLGVVIDTRYSENTPYGFVQFHEVGAVIVPIVR